MPDNDGGRGRSGVGGEEIGLVFAFLAKLGALSVTSAGDTWIGACPVTCGPRADCPAPARPCGGGEVDVRARTCVRKVDRQKRPAGKPPINRKGSGLPDVARSLARCLTDRSR